MLIVFFIYSQVPSLLFCTHAWASFYANSALQVQLQDLCIWEALLWQTAGCLLEKSSFSCYEWSTIVL
ncbi:hypothetical protein DUNSADRAFT_17437 [Dunaliella salina]|uniref:Secreted protein n=1 Tax=Dunaliella salina TaxID=3046 RepID=A0ABQ7H038_DUNSA|nr:hypothetical protein DUNSADRAFT_17437 [Dunaliella salina]|eukprot:KAF5840220.1 hypothetical protein DUNSADRAFT_17437 [Dunaliella salina]